MTNTETMQQAISELTQLLNDTLDDHLAYAKADWTEEPDALDNYLQTLGACMALKEALGIVNKAAEHIVG